MKQATDGNADDVGAPSGEDVTAAIDSARRGFRRDVAALITALEGARLFVPLAKSIAELPVGVDQEVGDELSLSPHLLFDDDRVGYLPVFTRADLARARDGSDRLGPPATAALEYAALPGPVVSSSRLAIVDDEHVEGMLLNPFDATELILQRHEIASIAQGRPLPLVGYVGEIPYGEDEERLIAEMDGPPPTEVVEAIENVLEHVKGAPRFVLSRTFNPERDLEPHLTLNVIGGEVGANGEPPDRSAVAGKLAEALDGLLPPPFYIDILFDDPKLV